MATKRTKPTHPPKAGNVLTIAGRKDKTYEQDVAWVALDPTFTAGCFLADQNKNLPNVNTNAFVDEVQEHADAVKRGDLSRGEEMLTAQAHSLNSLFYSMANRSAANSKEGYVEAAETYMKLAMRAQSQCRSTWEAIAEIKNPRQVAFVKQANMGHNVQVNNGTRLTALPSRAEETENQQSKLSEGRNELLQDARASTLAGRIDPPMETMGAVDRTEDAGR